MLELLIRSTTDFWRYLSSVTKGHSNLHFVILQPYDYSRSYGLQDPLAEVGHENVEDISRHQLDQI